MMLMLQDRSVTVQKKAIQVTAKIYKYTLMWLCRSKSVTEEMEASWNSVCDLKKYIVKLLDSDLDGYFDHINTGCWFLLTIYSKSNQFSESFLEFVHMP